MKQMLIATCDTGEVTELRRRLSGAFQLNLASSSAELAVALQGGGYDYLLIDRRRLLERHGNAHTLDSGSEAAEASVSFVSRNPLMRTVYAKLFAVAPTLSTVLLTGETGTGKNVIARQIHNLSGRHAAPFVSVHCGAIPEGLLESELFGHEKGAFTGAVRRKLGKFELACGGTLFLDEIGTVSPSTQVKLLQVLHERSFSRVGGNEVIAADVRIIAATNDDLRKSCETGTFRTDLFYRLNVFPIEVPPLRAHVEDIPILVEGFLKRFNRLNQKQIEGIEPTVLTALQRYPWPGNIRELENLIERASILESAPRLTAAGFPAELFAATGPQGGVPPAARHSLHDARHASIEAVERQYLILRLTEHRGQLNAVAKAAGIGVRQLHKLMVKYDLHKENFRRPPGIGTTASASAQIGTSNAYSSDQPLCLLP
jgi:DNA-binding NtrC family response regulator